MGEESSLLAWLSSREVGSISPWGLENCCNNAYFAADPHPALLQLAACCLPQVNQIISNNCSHAFTVHWRAAADPAAGLKWAGRQTDNLQTDSLLPAEVYCYLEDCTQQAGLEKFVVWFFFFFYTREIFNYAVRAVEEINAQYKEK